MVQEIKAIIFDIGGVLQVEEKKRKNKNTLHFSGVHESVAKKLGVSIDQYFDAIDSWYVKSMEGIISKRELLKHLSINLNVPAKKIEELYYRAYRRKFKVNKELLKVAKKLKKNYQVAILSDQWHLSKEAHLPKSFKNLFDPIILSCEAGMRKPSTGIYKLILKILKLNPSQVVFIDNQSWNTLPAHALGMNTILHVENQKTIQELKKFGVRI